jgi:hypothetical protein
LADVIQANTLAPEWTLFDGLRWLGRGNDLASLAAAGTGIRVPHVLDDVGLGLQQFELLGERYVPGPNQQLLFEALPLETKRKENAPPEPLPAKPRRKQRRKFVFPEFLPVRREDHSLQRDALPCGCCGADRVVIRTHITKQLELLQAQTVVPS